MNRHTRMLSIAAGCIAATLAFGFPGTAMAGDTPEAASGFKLATAEEVKDAVAKGGMIVDTRVANEFAEEHLKGAVNVPYRERSAKAADFNAAEDQFDLGKLPQAKETAVVLYCNGPACWKSYKGSVLAAKGGYSNVLWYRAGFPDWKGKGLPIE
jgi:rhodanese-related sulfurtransferase